MSLDEYEVVVLIDLDDLSQEDCAKADGNSQNHGTGSSITARTGRGLAEYA